VGSEGTRRAGRGFSLLETTIAVAILGLGLIMVAAVFPAALSEHRSSADRGAALDMIPQAAALLRGRVDPNQLWYQSGLPQGQDSPWYLLPTLNLAVGGTTWDAMFQPAAPTDPWYANLISGAAAGTGNGLYFSVLDCLSDRAAPRPQSLFDPFTDAEFQEAPNRLCWFAFYRRRANGSVDYSVAVCKARRGQRFAEQDASMVDAPGQPTVLRLDRRLPVPWRVRVGWAGGRQLSNSATAATPALLRGGEGLGDLAPPGSRLMVQGTAFFNGVLPTPVPSGRMLTVSNRVNATTADVLEELEDLQLYNFSNGTGMAFDVWVFPPAFEGVASGKESPILAWRAHL